MKIQSPAVKPDFSRCFGCGADNPRGLHLQKQLRDHTAFIDCKVEKEFCGYSGILHGGISMTILDECMNYAIASYGINTVTLEMHLKYLSPGLEGHTVRGEANVVKREGKNIEVYGTITDTENGKSLVECTGIFHEINLEHFFSKNRGSEPASK